MKAKTSIRTKTVSYARIRALKARDRQCDWQRLARGEVTPEQLQEENAIVRNASEFRILNLREAARHYRVINRRAGR